MRQPLQHRFHWIRGKRRDGRVSRWPGVLSVITSTALAFLFFATTAGANPPGATIEYQPMTSEGLAAGLPFEAWVVFDLSSDPSIPGLALPAGAALRFTFPQAVLLHGWSQGPIPVPFTVGLDPQDPRTIVLKLSADLPAGPPERPGLKAIHLRWGPLNPTQAGDYTISIQLSDAGGLSGITQAIAHITPTPVPNVAAYNELHQSRNEDWQHVKVGQMALLPIDLLVTLPDKARSFMTLRPTGEGSLEILSDGKQIGMVTQHGVPLTFKPVPFGPGSARLGIVRFQVTTGSVPGVAEIDAQLQGGPRYTLHVVVER